jgi:hypothetical protein
VDVDEVVRRRKRGEEDERRGRRGEEMRKRRRCRTDYRAPVLYRTGLLTLNLASLAKLAGRHR